MKRAEHQPETITVSIYAGVFVKLWSVQGAGTLIPQHSHEFPHMTLVMQGSVRVYRADDLVGDYHAPDVIHIPAGVFHSFLTLTPGVCLACIHNADHLDGDEPAVSQHADLQLED